MQKAGCKIFITAPGFPGGFFLAGLFIFSISILTISWYSLKAARKNPVESLRYE
jgi:ABC-type antimicrobial peptide transport system permease subunit